ncbi:hypothetical protein L204_105373 [Cryptococcus depauperatus]
MVNPPPRGQNIRALIDGVTTRRCQEWTMEFLHRLEQRGLVSQTPSRFSEPWCFRANGSCLASQSLASTGLSG